MTFTGQGVADRDVVLGVSIEGQQRAFPLMKVKGSNPVEDQVGGVPDRRC